MVYSSLAHLEALYNVGHFIRDRGAIHLMISSSCYNITMGVYLLKGINESLYVVEGPHLHTFMTCGIDTFDRVVPFIQVKFNHSL